MYFCGQFLQRTVVEEFLSLIHICATATINSDSAGTIFSSGSGTLDYIKEQVIPAPIGGEITAYNGSNHTYSSGAVIMSISNVAAPDTSDARSSLTAAQSTAAAAQAKVSEIQTRILKLQDVYKRQLYP